MAKNRAFMYVYVVPIGDMPTNPAEEAFRRVQVQLAVSRRLEIDQSWSYDLQSPFWRIYVNNRSGASIFFAGESLALKAGRIYLIPAWVRFKSAASRSLTQDYLHFYVTGLPPTLLRRVFSEPSLLPRDSVLEGLSRRWQDGFSSSSAFAKLGWAAALAQAAVTVATENLPETARRNCFDSMMEFSPIGPALDCMEKRLAQPPTNPELARLCHLPTDRFGRQFRRVVGITPAQYGLERRIAIAAHRLTATSHTLEAIASDLGFTDRFHFSRAFKKRLGIPPVAYRRLHRMEIQ